MASKRPAHLTDETDSKPVELRSAEGPLTERQRLFVMHVVHDKMNFTAAARAAGIPSPNVQGPLLSKHPKVQAAIAREREEYAKASGVTKKAVIDGFIEAIDMARIKADPLAMISGWREVGKMCGFYEPTKTKVEISVSGQVLLQKMQAMTDEELLALAQEQGTPLEGEFEVVDDDES